VTVNSVLLTVRVAGYRVCKTGGTVVTRGHSISTVGQGCTANLGHPGTVYDCNQCLNQNL